MITTDKDEIPESLKGMLQRDRQDKPVNVEDMEAEIRKAGSRAGNTDENGEHMRPDSSFLDG